MGNTSITFLLAILSIIETLILFFFTIEHDAKYGEISSIEFELVINQKEVQIIRLAECHEIIFTSKCLIVD